MRTYLWIVLLWAACSDPDPVVKRQRLVVADGSCQRVERVCLESNPPQCLDVCADEPGGNVDCSVSSDSERDMDVAVCGSDECVTGVVAAPVPGSGGEPGSGTTFDDLDGGCPEEAPLCPDGKTTVVRRGIYCEFDPCPGEAPPPVYEGQGQEVVICAPTAGNGGCGVQRGADGREQFVCACPADARICPDGTTSVGRTGPSCEFAPCPT